LVDGLCIHQKRCLGIIIWSSHDALATFYRIRSSVHRSSSGTTFFTSFLFFPATLSSPVISFGVFGSSLHQHHSPNCGLYLCNSVSLTQPVSEAHQYPHSLGFHASKLQPHTPTVSEEKVRTEIDDDVSRVRSFSSFIPIGSLIKCHSKTSVQCVLHEPDRAELQLS
jgi:hypothetical protein